MIIFYQRLVLGVPAVLNACLGQGTGDEAMEDDCIQSALRFGSPTSHESALGKTVDEAMEDDRLN